MKYRFFSFIIIVTMIVGCSKPSILYQEYKPEQIIHYSQMKNVNNISNFIVYLNKGELIPLKVTLDSDLLDIAKEEINLRLKKKVYFRLRMPENLNFEKISAMTKKEKQGFIKNIMIYLSSDAKRWAPYTNIEAVEQVFGIKGGSFSYGMGITKEEGIAIFITARTN